MSETDNKLNDMEEELNWLRGYAKSLEQGIEDIRKLINESTGVVGFHLNGDVALWDELLDCSTFSFVEDNIREKKDSSGPTGRVTSEARKVLYIKQYKHMPCTVMYTPVYGGIKYVRENATRKEG